MGIIYCYTNNINGKKYIGQTMNPRQRFNAHKSTAFNEKDGEYNSPLHRAFRKYGYENFTYEVLTEADTIEELNGLETYFIAHYDTQIPNGYNILPGGKNYSRTLSDETKEKLMYAHASLTEQEVIELRIAYKNHESPSKIYKEKYQDKMHYNSFLNIWTGSRYKTIMPEVFQEGKRKTKLTEEIVRCIKQKKQDGATCQELADEYGVCKSTISDICRGRTWKHVQI